MSLTYKDYKKMTSLFVIIFISNKKRQFIHGCQPYDSISFRNTVRCIDCLTMLLCHFERDFDACMSLNAKGVQKYKREGMRRQCRPEDCAGGQKARGMFAAGAGAECCQNCAAGDIVRPAGAGGVQAPALWGNPH